MAADLHWGKAATFRSSGIPIPGGATRDDLARLDAALDRAGARRLIILGDLFHSRAGRMAARTLTELRRWRAFRSNLEILLVRGNHDRHAGDPPADLRIACVDAPALVPPFVLRHVPVVDPAGYTLSGHVHPGLTLVGRGLERQQLPCFLVGRRTAILPAFGGFTGLAAVEPGPTDRAFVIADEEVVEVRARAS